MAAFTQLQPYVYVLTNKHSQYSDDEKMAHNGNKTQHRFFWNNMIYMKYEQ